MALIDSAIVTIIGNDNEQQSSLQFFSSAVNVAETAGSVTLKIPLQLIGNSLLYIN